MAFQNLCPPALIYLLFSITQVVIDTVKGLYNTAMIKIWVAFVFTILLNYLCDLGLGIISWLIVFIPFILMTLIVAILLLMFGLDPATGKIKVTDTKTNWHKHGSELNDTHGYHPIEADKTAEENKNKKSKDDDVMTYYKNKPSGVGSLLGGSSSATNITKKTKEKTILTKSLLFYSETPHNSSEKKPETSFPEDNKRLDTRRYVLHVNKVHNILSSMGESEIASHYQTKAMACVNSANKMAKNDAESSITSCEKELMDDIFSKFSVETRNKFNELLISSSSNCETLDTYDRCYEKINKSWWN
tara:strand:+ start:439 stop:1347 length:909 start_codon:yes stop_codon:yes gene_type:complete